ncbi:DUF192 domain-containing protein [Brevundimonas sp.]|uniref:DUF192 domain-containing protein n=1 Tax=Brevundimonas sp. TaxID=1871086 RepID=UPI0040333D92
MPLSRRLFVGLMLLAAACAPKPPVDAAGRPLEPLTVVTSSGRHDFLVEIADDEPERQKGLMFRPPLADDRGMLFQFEAPAEQSFWMKNTPSSLDIVYVAADGRIVSIAHNATPFSEQPLPSYGAAKGVLEVRAGRMTEIGAKAGDRVEHPFFGNWP